jgi:DNA-3-methyladenine glycosylase
MLNVVTEADGFPAAVLIRAIQPVEGVRIIERRRAGKDTAGPGKLTQALGVTDAENGIDLTLSSSRLRIEPGLAVQNQFVTKGPRVGLYTVPEPWRSKPWRFCVKGWRLESADIAPRSNQASKAYRERGQRSKERVDTWTAKQHP